MKVFICFFLLLSFAHAGRDDQALRIERDISVMISQLQLLLDKDPEQLLLPLKSADRDKFEEEILQMKIQLEKVSRKFADQGRFPTGKKVESKK
jgi:hypothetical protein